jgi:hypothetical protein
MRATFPHRYDNWQGGVASFLQVLYSVQFFLNVIFTYVTPPELFGATYIRARVQIDKQNNFLWKPFKNVSMYR